MAECIIERSLEIGLVSPINGGTLERVAGSVVEADKETGQLIASCDVPGCSAEFELYPLEQDGGMYSVEPDSVQVARFICKRERL